MNITALRTSRKTGWSRLAIPALCFALAAQPGQAQPVQASSPQFQNGDRVCFIGDSITDIGLYHSYLQLFYATRFPERSIHYFGAGHSGGRSTDCLKRVSWDILPHEPTVATVMFGMNDMGPGSYAQAASVDEAEQAIAKQVGEVQVNYEKLLDALAKENIRLILLGPSIYDDTAQLEKPPVPYRSLALKRWTERLGQIAAQRGAGFVDIGTLMTDINHRIQERNPKATLTSGDRVHGKAPGNIVMAYSILKAQGIDPYVARIAVDAASGRTVDLYNAKISNLQTAPRGISFTCLENALPFVPPKAAAEGIALVPFTAELNQEILKVTGLSAGLYTLKIDDTVVGDYTAENFSAGVNLALNPKTPQYQQAEVLCRLNEERHKLLGYLRTLPFLRHTLYGGKIDPNNRDAIDQFLKDEYEKRKPGDYTRHVIEVYLMNVYGQLDDVTRRHEELIQKMEQGKHPRTHGYNVLPKQ